MKKTVVSHFYNEEHLLPWWLDHHKKIFDHGILIDYHSTDRSMEIIREICPDWELRYTRNKYFDSVPIDREVMDIERGLDGWRMCLNTTEFLYGNINHLDNRTEPTQYFVGNYVFVDMEDPAKESVHLFHNKPLHEQRCWGYDEFKNTGEMKGGIMGRMNRSLHNYPVTYEGGRHWGGKYGDNYPKSFDDLVIFYYGWADASSAGLKRKTQIKSKINEGGTVHHRDKDSFRHSYTELRNLSRDLREPIKHICSYQYPDENSTVVIDEPIQNVIELAITYEGTVVEIPATDSKLIQAEPRVIG
jgi:hypothetical protein